MRQNLNVVWKNVFNASTFCSVATCTAYGNWKWSCRIVKINGTKLQNDGKLKINKEEVVFSHIFK